jgi:hypothetical protein
MIWLVSHVEAVRVRGMSRTGRRVVLGVLASILVLVVLFVYQVLGARAMASKCDMDGPNGSNWNSVTYNWSWSPLGFQCRYDNGKTLTSLWP